MLSLFPRPPISRRRRELETVQVERDGGVATVTLNRPEKMNSLNQELIAALPECCASWHGIQRSAAWC